MVQTSRRVLKFTPNNYTAWGWWMIENPIIFSTFDIFMKYCRENKQETPWSPYIIAIVGLYDGSPNEYDGGEPSK